jgi:hypothetical protein
VSLRSRQSVTVVSPPVDTSECFSFGMKRFQ